MKLVGTVYSRVLGERLPLYEYNDRLVPCICDPKTQTVCFMRKANADSVEDVMEFQEIHPVGVLYFDVPVGRRRAIREHLDDQGVPYEEDKGLARSWFVARPSGREAMDALKAWLKDHGVR